jgi:peptide chain release factor 1
LPYNDHYEYEVNMSEFTVERYCGGGPGGQHRNTTDSNVRITHKPTKLSACANTKSQHRNKQLALSILIDRIQKHENGANKKDRNDKKRAQIGNTGRGTRVRTYNFIENRVKDERVNKQFRTQDIMKGKLNLIYREIKE